MGDDKLAVIQGDSTVAELQKIENKTKELIIEFGKLISKTKEVNRSLKSSTPKEYANAIKELNNATKDLNRSQLAMANNMTRVTRLERQVAQMLRDQSRAIRDVAAATRDESRAREAAERINTQQQRTAREAANAQAAQNRASREAANTLTAESRARQQATREAAANTRQNQLNSSAHVQLTRQVNNARQTARDYGAEMFNLNQRLRQGSITQTEYRRQLSQLSRDFRNSSTEAIRLQRELNRINQATLPSAQRNGGLLGRVTDIVKGIGIITVIDNLASSFYKMGVSAFETSVKLETLRLAQMSVFKSADEVGRQNTFLTDIAQKYGIEIIGLTESYTKFSASAQGTVLEGGEAKNIFDAISRSSAMLGVSTDETSGILRALGQMMSKGKIQAEELRGQLGDRMAGAFKLFADGLGVSTAELDKMLQKGEVLSDVGLPKMAAQLNKKYKLGLNEEINTSQANLTRLTNQWTIFVDAIENRAGVVSGTVGTLTGMFTGLLKEMTPSQFITDIQNQQIEFNKLGILLKQNFTDEEKRKNLINEMIAINPNFLDGLHKEKVSLDQINERLRLTNEQYVQKILLQKFEDEINETLEEQAERITIIAEAYARNSEEMNNLTNAQQKVIQSFTDGKISFTQADNALLKLGGNVYSAWNVLTEMESAINNVSLTSKGFIRGTKGISESIEEATKKFDLQQAAINNIIGASGNMLGMNTKLVNSNTLLGNSFDTLAVKEALAAKQRTESYSKTITKARQANEKFATFDGFFFDSKSGKNTGKKFGEWDIKNDNLVKRETTKLADKVTKPKTPKASRLDAVQKDYLKDLQAIKDLELAVNETSYIEGKQNERDYLNSLLNINNDFFNKKISYLKGNNAEERKQRADAILDQAKLIKDNQKKVFEIDANILEENYKKQSNIIDRNSNILEKANFSSNVSRLDSQIEIDNQSIEQAYDYYSELINIAKNANQETIDLERKRDEEIGQLEDRRADRISERYQASIEDLETQTEFIQGLQNLTYEQQKSVVLANTKLSIEEKEYQLSVLEKGNQIKINNIEIEKLKTLRSQLLAKVSLAQVSGMINPDDIQEIAKLEGMIKNLENSNIEIDIEMGSTLSPQMAKTKDVVSQGLADLGLENVSSQFDAVFKKIIDGTFSAKDAAILAASAIADALSAISNKTKENTIANLDEQLKHTQETTEQELEFINGRLAQLNALEDLTEEQYTQRNALEDEARTIKEQQAQREKMIEAQKAKAEQKAASNQALINGALAATMTLAQMGFIAGAIPAGLALGFGIAQSIAIMSKDPVPKYFVGRKGGNAEVAITQDGGREFISNEKGEITSLGSDNGDQLTYLNKGDNVHTAKETKAIISKLGKIPKIGDNIFQKIALQSLRGPAPVIMNNTIDNSDAIAEKVGAKFENALKKYDKPVVVKNGGKILLYRGANLGLQIGEYDQNGNEKYYS